MRCRDVRSLLVGGGAGKTFVAYIANRYQWMSIARRQKEDNETARPNANNGKTRKLNRDGKWDSMGDLEAAVYVGMIAEV